MANEVQQNKVPARNSVDARSFVDTVKKEALQKNDGVKYRISGITFILMLIVAGLFDLLSFPLISNFVVVVASVVFALWWKLLGIKLISGRKTITYLTTHAIEHIPVLSIFPGIMLGVSIMFLITRAEDRTGINLSGKLKEGLSQKTSTARNKGNIEQGTNKAPSRQKQQTAARSETGAKARAKTSIKLPETTRTPKDN